MRKFGIVVTARADLSSTEDYWKFFAFQMKAITRSTIARYQKQQQVVKNALADGAWNFNTLDSLGVMMMASIWA